MFGETCKPSFLSCIAVTKRRKVYTGGNYWSLKAWKVKQDRTRRIFLFCRKGTRRCNLETKIVIANELWRSWQRDVKCTFYLHIRCKWFCNETLENNFYELEIFSSFLLVINCEIKLSYGNKDAQGKEERREANEKYRRREKTRAKERKARLGGSN